LDAVHNVGLRFFAGVACFSDHASNFRSLQKRPELWPVLENGRRRQQMEWYVGMSPTDRSRQVEALEEIKSVARSYPVDGIFLDFARWPLHWEMELRPERDRPLDSSFDAATLAMFEEAAGALPRNLETTSALAAWIRRNRLSEWIEFKCKVVNDFVSEARNALKEARADAGLGIYAVPNVKGLTEPLTTFCCNRLRGSHRRSPLWLKSLGKRRCRSCKPIRTEARTSVETGDLQCRTPTGAKPFRRSPGGTTSAD
jgi:hypothetical protein